MPKGPDPRESPAPREEVPQLVRAGVDEFNARRFWHAHEHWEAAWHALRAADETDAAQHLHGMILVAAALENATRGKEDGFKRQMAEGLHLLRGHRAGASTLGIAQAPVLLDALTSLYLDACRRRDWTQWNAGGWSAPRIVLS